ncbi:MAG: cobaltochelatase subunit CobT [Acidiferrobacterales bacterium]
MAESNTARDSTLETFCHATAAAVRAVARRDDLNIDFQSSKATLIGNQVQLPALWHPLDYAQVARVRGEADAIALRLRYRDDRIHARRVPKQPIARRIYDAAEQTRVEALGSRYMAGVAQNLAASLEQQCRSRGYDHVNVRQDVQLPDAVRFVIRQVLSGEPPPPAARALVGLWRSWLEARAGDTLSTLKHYIDDQHAYAIAVRRLLRELEFGEDEPDEVDADDAERSDESEGESGEHQTAIADVSGPVRDADPVVHGTTPEGIIGETKDVSSMPGAGHPDFQGHYGNERRKPGYRVYTTEFDEVVSAEELCHRDELARLRGRLDQRLAQLRSRIARLANRLERRLLARQQRGWEFNVDDGLIDSARLSRVVISPDAPYWYKREHETDFRDTVVALLIDNSGSMRGRPITVAALTADIVARTLERCGVKVEILGFTTRAWKGGRSRERWLAGSKPQHPGRLNDLRHIVYKAAEVSWRRARTNLGLMLREGILKENIDGEAVLWAHQRLIAQPEQRRILLVLSDGAPVDDSTLSANTASYLERHLCDVTEWIETRSPVELLAIGIGHDVTRYYQHAVTIMDLEQLGSVIMQELTTLFEMGPTGRRRSRSRRRRVA